MKRLKRAGLVGLGFLLLVFAGIRLVRHWLWTARPPGALPIAQREQSPIDLRPAAIAKLQGLVQDGSDSLYRLRIDSLETELVSGTLVLRGVGVYPDSTVLQRWRREERLPDDVFRVELKRLRLSGLELGDLVHRRNLDFRALVLEAPRITVYHRPQPYNAARRTAAQDQTLFSLLRRRIDRLAIDTVRVERGTIIDWNRDVRNAFGGVTLLLRDVRVDSASERDTARFLFAKAARLQTGAVRMPLGRSGYDVSFGHLVLDGPGRELNIRDLALHPRGGREAFTRRQRERTTVFTLDVPAVTLHRADWWAALHGDGLRAEEAVVQGPRMDVYLDKRLPTTPGIRRDNFPQQLLQDLSTPVSVRRVRIAGGGLTYDEFNDATNALGHLAFSGINLTATNVTNIASEIRIRRIAQVQASGRFLGISPMQAQFTLELPRNRLGAFRSSLHLGPLEPAAVNPFAEALGQVRVTSGRLNDAAVQIRGNNNVLRGRFQLRYSDLHLEILKTTRNEEGRLKRKTLVSKVGNLLFVKDNNPARGELRQPEVTVARTDQPSFFNFLWNAILLGFLKTLGVPERFAPD